MRILVTGANGYLGQGIVRQLLEDGVDVIAADRSLEHVDGHAQGVACDLFALPDPYAALGRPDAVLHLAWRNGFVHNDPSHLEDLPLHYRFLERLAAGGVQRMAVMGSMHEVGFFEGSIRAETPCNPASLYGVGKNALRQATALLCSRAGIPWQWLRGFYIVGNSEHGSSIFSKITAAEKKGQSLFPFTTGQNQWDFLDYGEFCSQTAATVEQAEETGIINICSGRPEKLADRVERFIRENGYAIRLDYGKFPDRPYDSKAVWGDDSRIRAIMEKRA